MTAAAVEGAMRCNRRREYSCCSRVHHHRESHTTRRTIAVSTP
jgi:hypothetical protein